MTYSPLIQTLIDALRGLPGVGPKTAQRMAFQLLHKNKEKGLHLSEALKQSIQHIKRCERCQMLCEGARCELCQQSNRQAQTLCIVENPGDVVALEKTSHYRGLYFVLFGRLSPLDGIGPSDLGLDLLFERLAKEPIEEIIIATNSTVEGDATAHYISHRIHQAHAHIMCSRIAYGVPAGGELEYLDDMTLTYAINARTTIKNEC